MHLTLIHTVYVTAGALRRPKPDPMAQHAATSQDDALASTGPTLLFVAGCQSTGSESQVGDDMNRVHSGGCNS